MDYTEYAAYSLDYRSVVLDLEDGGSGDADGLANGTIVDAGGPCAEIESGGKSGNGGGGYRLRLIY